MAIWAFPFASSNGDRAYGPADLMQFYANLFSTGIVPNTDLLGSSAFQVTQTETPSLNFTVGSGVAIIGGGQVMNTAPKQFQIQIPLTTQSRMDSVVVQWNNSSRLGDVIYKVNSTQVIQTSDVYELQLATINVPANASSISQANITDTRADPTVCGYSSPFEKVDTGDLLAQFKSQLEANGKTFNDWFTSMKGQLSTDAAGNLQLQINNSIHDTGINIDGQDLNTITTPGIYFSLGNDLVSNAPSGAGKNSLGYQFSLVTVIKSAKSSQVRQIFYDSYESSTSNGDNLHNERKTYTRVGQGSPVVWGAWFEFAMIDESGLLTVKDLEVTGSLTKSTDTPFTKLPIKTGIPFAGNVYYRIKNGWIFINGYLTPTGNVGAGAVTTIATLPIEFAPKPEFAGSGSVFLASSDLNGGTRGATGTLVGSDGNIIISGSVAQTTVSRFGFSGGYPIE